MIKKRPLRRLFEGQSKHQVQEFSRESPTAIAVTVGWMVSILSTFVGQLVVLTGTMVECLNLLSEKATMLLNMLAATTIVTGLVAMLVTPVALKLRKVPPPRSVLVVAMVMGVLPLICWQVLRG